MVTLKGKYGEAKVFTDYIDQNAISQIQTILNHRVSDNAHTRIMPDCHADAGCVIGYTAKMNDIVIPNLIGVDIGCGVLASCFKNLKTDNKFFEYLDEQIRKFIPLGREIRDSIYSKLDMIMPDFILEEVKKLCKETNQDYGYVLRSLGTLGGGNHFIELGRSSITGNVWLTIHTGSRNFGLKIATYYQKLASITMHKEIVQKGIDELKEKYSGRELGTKIEKLKFMTKVDKYPKSLSYLAMLNKANYTNSLLIVQEYARINRVVIKRIIQKILDSYAIASIESVHNYIDGECTIRNGAVSAYKGEYTVIPFNMQYGIIIGTGLGNEDWNCSAPSGAGRVMSRTKAKKQLSMNEFKESMKDVWSSSISESTLDESPMVYKKPEDVLKYLKETVHIDDYIKPLYSLKG